MNTRLLTLALKKQRLQLQSATLRARWVGHCDGVKPICNGIDRLGDGVHWLRGHPQALLAAGVAGGVALLVARPRTLWRLARRSFVAWQVWRKTQDWLSRRQAIRPLFSSRNR